MIKFFRLIRQRLLNDGKFSKYSVYAIGEILLVVIGILIAVCIGEWRQNIKNEKELQDKIRMSALDSLYKNAERGILKEIDKM